MRTGNRIIFAATALFLLPLAMSAQSAQEIDTTSFNALEYSMQKRYRPQNEAFVANTFMDNTFIRLLLRALRFIFRGKDVHPAERREHRRDFFRVQTQC